MATPPFCTGYAWHACGRAKAKFAARFGLLLAGVELLLLIALMIIGLIGLYYQPAETDAVRDSPAPNSASSGLYARRVHAEQRPDADPANDGQGADRFLEIHFRFSGTAVLKDNGGFADRAACPATAVE